MPCIRFTNAVLLSFARQVGNRLIGKTTTFLWSEITIPLLSVANRQAAWDIPNCKYLIVSTYLDSNHKRTTIIQIHGQTIDSMKLMQLNIII